MTDERDKTLVIVGFYGGDRSGTKMVFEQWLIDSVLASYGGLLIGKDSFPGEEPPSEKYTGPMEKYLLTKTDYGYQGVFEKEIVND